MCTKQNGYGSVAKHWRIISIQQHTTCNQLKPKFATSVKHVMKDLCPVRPCLQKSYSSVQLWKDLNFSTNVCPYQSTRLERMICLTEYRYYCIQVLLYTGTTVYRYYCIQVLYTGSTVYRYYCIQVLLYTGTTVYRFYCIQVLLYTGTTVYRFYCIQVLLYTGSTVYRFYCCPQNKTMQLAIKTNSE